MADFDALELEGMVTTLTVLCIERTDLAALRETLAAKVGQMPGFFGGAPVALDLSAVDGPDDTPFASELSLDMLMALVREQHLLPVAVRNAHPQRRQEAAELGLACLRGTPRGESGGTRTARNASPKEAVAGGAAPTMVLRTPVRSGQVVYAEGGDIIVMASVNSGGELIADGHIHVYGALRGRALAGAHGDVDARIFCTNLQADLVSIAGTYLRADELPEDHRGKPAQVFLRDDALVISSLL